MSHTDDLIAFAHWVAKEVAREDFEEDADIFAEIACRKLFKMNIIQKKGSKWAYIGEENDK